MAFLSWDETFSTNIKNFDADHKKLLSLLNELYQKVFECEQLSEEHQLAEEILNELLHYVKEHFTSEETLMIKFDYPEYGTHKVKHEYYIAKVNEMINEHKTGGVALSFPIFMLVKEWIATHILVDDKKYASFFNNKGIY